jgi:RNA polymerase sigma-70 factor (ECF subfamily)
VVADDTDAADDRVPPVSRGRRGPRARGSPGDRSGRSDEVDEGLIVRMAQGDPVAVGALYDRYARPAFSLARRICGDEGLAEEVVQEVFVAVWRDPSRFDPGRGRFSSWLLTLTHHKAVDAARRANAMSRRAVAMTFEEDERAVPPAPGADHLASGALVAGQVREALAKLPEEQRKALCLMYYGGYTQREVASLTGVPLGTVKSRTYNGVRLLRRLLAELAFEPSGTV